MKAYDLLVQCETGLASITGAPQEPGRVGVSVCDIGCGMYAHTGVLEALLERGSTGRGKSINVSLFDAMADWMTVPLLHQDYGGAAPARVGLNHPSIAPYGAYTCSDGEQVVVSIQNNREWQNFCEQVLERPELTTAEDYRDNVDRCANRPALDREINRVFGSLTRGELVVKLAAARIAFGAVNSVADFSQHAQLRRVDVQTPSGPVALVAPPVQAAGEASGLGPVPALGEHDAAVREEFRANA
jgi:crotonobetainyl-CoA:carnitine CoA-transferase CaiB-like acyl-CoA transferase